MKNATHEALAPQALPYYETTFPGLKECLERFETTVDRFKQLNQFATLKTTLEFTEHSMDEFYRHFERGQQSINDKDWQAVVSSFLHLNRYFQDVLIEARFRIEKYLPATQDNLEHSEQWQNLIRKIQKLRDELATKQRLIPYHYPIDRSHLSFFLRHMDEHLSTTVLRNLNDSDAISPILSSFAERFAASVSSGDMQDGIKALRKRIEDCQDSERQALLRQQLVTEYLASIMSLKLRLQPYVENLNVVMSQIFIAITTVEKKLQSILQQSQLLANLNLGNFTIMPAMSDQNAVSVA